jgi:hypothetical protein
MSDWFEKCTLAPLTGVPDDFLPYIGALAVQHSFLERKLQEVIQHLGKMDFNTVVSIMSQIRTISTKVEILNNLAKTKITDSVTRAKFSVLADRIEAISAERNTIIHSLPYAYSPSKHELTHFREKNLTRPQIKIQKPYSMTIEGIVDVIREAGLVASWLGMCLRNCLPDDVEWKEGQEPDLSKLECHPDWKNDAAFPWQDDLRKKLEKANRALTNELKAK